MSLDEESLNIAANGGPMNLDKWPSIVEPLLERLEYIIYNAFPMPEMPPEPSTIQYQQQYLNPTSSFLHEPNTVPSSSNKENAAPSGLSTPPQPQQSSIVPSSSTERIPESLPGSQAAVPPSLPAPLFLILQSIQSTLRSLFASKPPHTIQRLAELILRPNAHYKTLPAYLRAVDRVISVTSSADVFPFPMQSGTAQPQTNGALNGAESSLLLPDNALGSDESLGGALLTPIPWLNNAASPGVEGADIDEMSIPTPNSALQDQPLAQSADPPTQQTVPVDASGSVLEGEMTAEPEGIPHARGPSLLGVEDMGLQDGKGVEMTLLDKEAEAAADAISSTDDSATQSSQTPTQESVGGDAGASTVLATTMGQKNDTTEADADGDGDITLSDETTISQGGQDQDQDK